MTPAIALLDRLRRGGIGVEIANSNLKLVGPDEALRPLVDEIRRSKPALISEISKTAQRLFAVELTAAFVRLAAAYRPGDEHRDIGRAELAVLTSEMRRIERGETSDLQAARAALAAWERAYEIAPDIGTAKNDSRKNSPARARYIIE